MTILNVLLCDDEENHRKEEKERIQHQYQFQLENLIKIFQFSPQAI